MNKPEGAGYIESSVEDRYNSMKGMPTTLHNGDHPRMQPVGDRAAVCGKPSGGMASDAQTTKS